MENALNNNLYFGYYFGFWGYYFSAGFFAYLKNKYSIHKRSNNILKLAY